MFKHRLRLPSPALVIATVALALVLGGTAVAASTAYLTKTTGTKLVKKLAPTLTVKSAHGPATLASGQTEYGTIGSQPPATGVGSGDEVGDNASLPFPAPVALDDAHVQLVGADASPSQCPGTASNPKAARGYVCIYPYSVSNATLEAGYIWGSPTSKYGFQMGWQASTNGDGYVFANWAYTAP